MLPLIIGLICGVVTALIAHSKGRSPIGWFFVGFFAGLIGLIISLCVSDLKKERAKWDHATMEQRRLREQLRQEQLKSEVFRQHSAARLDMHDDKLGVDTRQVPVALPGTSAENTLGVLAEAQSAPSSADTAAEALAGMGGGNAADDLADMADTAGAVWYYLREGRQEGPVAASVIARLLRGNGLGRESLVWTQGMAEWQPISKVDPFRRAVQP